MKQHIEAIAMLSDVLVRALDQVEVATEILGFTTAAWSGGRAQRDWLQHGRPKHPGRLNELCHMIYKDADTRWRRARPSIAALLKPDLFREGVDGEAVEWACSRMSGRDVPRRILLVVSDGSPMDTATNLANDTCYLDNHLKQVVARNEHSGEVEIYGLGVGLDLSPYYSRSLAIDISQGLTNAVFFDLIEMLRGHHRR
jgi:cobaltochelatase CobT